MTFLPPSAPPEDCPVAYNDCTCPCHRTPGMHHIMPCCTPDGKSPFLAHLERSSEIVKDWPDWKKDMWPKEKCTHPRQTTTMLGAATGTDWKCQDCGEPIGPQSGRRADVPALESLMPKDMSEARRIITQLHGELSTTKALLHAELQRNGEKK